VQNDQPRDANLTEQNGGLLEGTSLRGIERYDDGGGAFGLVLLNRAGIVVLLFTDLLMFLVGDMLASVDRFSRVVGVIVVFIHGRYPYRSQRSNFESC
jgi:hypothetical protein